MYSQQQTTPVTASDSCQKSILQNSQNKMFSNEKSETVIFCKPLLRIWYFSLISVIKIGFSPGKNKLPFLTKKVIIKLFVCNYLNWMRIQYVTNELHKYTINLWSRYQLVKKNSIRYISPLCSASTIMQGIAASNQLPIEPLPWLILHDLRLHTHSAWTVPEDTDFPASGLSRPITSFNI